MMALRLTLTTVTRRSATRSTLKAMIPSIAQFSAEAIVPGVGKGKTSTGLVGVPVDHEAVPKMIVKYQALLDRMANSDMPQDAHYRITVEKIARFRIEAAKANMDNPEAVEELCNCGQVEELVEQADDEMQVLEMYLENRWWELVKDAEIQYNPSSEQEDQDAMDDAEDDAKASA